MQENLSWYFLWLLDEQQCIWKLQRACLFSQQFNQIHNFIIYGILWPQLNEIAICNSMADEETKADEFISFNACNIVFE